MLQTPEYLTVKASELQLASAEAQMMSEFEMNLPSWHFSKGV